MSHFSAKAINPETGKAERVVYVDDWKGQRHRYGVMFADGTEYPAEEIKRVAEED